MLITRPYGVGLSRKPHNRNNNGKASKTSRKAHKAPEAVASSLKTLSELQENHELWYKIRVLIYDLRNMAEDKTCERRTLQTTNELYISGPYFSPSEAAIIKAARIDDNTTLEQAITTSLRNFFEKRRACGDSRPCGPHDIAPVYMSCFGIDRAEIEDEKFVSRLRRSGLGSA